MVSFNHTLLGPIIGLQLTPYITQFRGIPFATYPERFTQSTVKTSLGPDERNFTQYGDACPQTIANADPGPGTVYGGGPLPGDHNQTYGEFTCLVLSVSSPTAVLSPSSSPSSSNDQAKLPVLVYIHGGGFTSGAGSTTASHNPGYIADLAVKENQPVITVAIQYRLTWNGFTVSDDLIEDAKSRGEPAGNYGLYDQRNALLWVKQFIAGFGGDPDNITVFGESAGSCAINYHMLSPVPIFKRAIMMSGTIATAVPAPLSVLQTSYNNLLNFLNISLTDPERLRKLRKVPIDQLLAAQDVGYQVPFAEDTDFFPTRPTWNNMVDLTANCSWVNEVIIGDTGFEGLFLPVFDSFTTQQFTNFLQSMVRTKNATAIFAQTYNITPTIDANLLLTKEKEIISDVVFNTGTQRTSLGLVNAGKTVYRYWFDMRNPFPGHNLYQLSHHWVDDYYIFQLYQFRMPTRRDREVSTEHARRWIRFAWGGAPWEEAYTADVQHVAVADIRDGWTVRTRVQDERIAQRRYRELEVLEELFRPVGDTFPGLLGAVQNITYT